MVKSYTGKLSKSYSKAQGPGGPNLESFRKASGGVHTLSQLFPLLLFSHLEALIWTRPWRHRIRKASGKLRAGSTSFPASPSAFLVTLSSTPSLLPLNSPSYPSSSCSSSCSSSPSPSSSCSSSLFVPLPLSVSLPPFPESFRQGIGLIGRKNCGGPLGPSWCIKVVPFCASPVSHETNAGQKKHEKTTSTQ